MDIIDINEFKRTKNFTEEKKENIVKFMNKIEETNEKTDNQNSSNNTTLLNNNSQSSNTVESTNINNSTESNYINPQSKNNEIMLKINNNIVSPYINNTNNNINENNIPIEQRNRQVLNQNDINAFPISQLIRQMFAKQNILNALIDQNKSIYLQKQLRIIRIIDIYYIIDQLHGNFREIMKDKNGNYFCSDLFKECNQEQRIKILKEISPSLADDCLNKYSSHAIQTLIDRSSSEFEFRLILYSFNDYNKLLYVSLDSSGAYTVQKIIERIPDRYREEFNFNFSSFIEFISRKKYGIVTVKKFISGTKNEAVTNQIMKLIYEKFMDLAVDQYANYLIQFLLEKWNNTPEGNEIKKLVRANFEKMCEKKYSSFICELYITKIISPEEKKELINSLDIEKIIELNNHHSMKILKILKILDIKFKPKLNNQIQNVNNIGFNMPNMTKSRFNLMNNNLYGNNNINNNIQFNNNFGKFH